MSNNKNNIEISPKYGLNPTIPICFWCGKDENELAVLGRIRKKDPRTGRPIPGSDEEAPHHMCINYDPCNECKASMSQGISIIGVKPSDGQHVEIQKGLYPTGTIVALKPEAFERIFKDNIDPDIYDEIMKHKAMFMDDDELKNMMKSPEDNA